MTTSGALPVQEPTTTSFNDPAYGEIERGVERKLGLPQFALNNIRTLGERSNSNQVSEADARSVYQIIPATRSGVMTKYGVDAYSGKAADAAMAAGHVLKESLARNNGDMAQAVGEYHGGTNRANWGPRTQSYIARVTGNGVVIGSNATAQSDFNINELTPEQVMNFDPSMLKHVPKPAKEPKFDAKAATLRGLVGDKGVAPSPVPDSTDLTTPLIIEAQAQETARATAQNAFTVGDKLVAGFKDVSLTASIYRAIDQGFPEYEAGWSKDLVANYGEYTKDAQSDEEFEAIISSTSKNDLANVLVDIRQTRERRGVYTATSSDALLYGLAGGLLDPAGIVVALATSGGFALAGIGSRAAFAAGRTGTGIASAMAEGALGNVAVVAALQASGTHATGETYLTAAAFGGVIGAATAGFQFRGAKANEALELFQEQAAAVKGRNTLAIAEANRKLGPDATPEQVATEVQRAEAASRDEAFRAALADVPDTHRFLSTEDLLTKPDVVKGTPATEAAAGKAAIPEQAYVPGVPEQPRIHAVTAIPGSADSIARHRAKGRAIVYMTPSEYHAAVGRPSPEAQRPGITDKLVKDISDNGLREIPWLDPSEQAGQEGRHRADALARLGYDTIPVALITPDLGAIPFRSAPDEVLYAPAVPEVPYRAAVPAVEAIPASAATPDVSTISAFTQEIIDRHGLDNIPDEAERMLQAEIIARAERFRKLNPIDPAALKTILSKVGMESTGNTLMRSGNAVLEAAAQLLLESSTGAGGRRSTAAIGLFQRQRMYMGHVSQYDNLYHAFRKEQGVGHLEAFSTGKVQREFDRRVADEIEKRGRSATGTFDENPLVVKAADDMEAGFQHMADDQRAVGTVGSHRLDTTSRGYMPRSILGRVIANMTPEQMRALRKVYAGQFMDVELNTKDIPLNGAQGPQRGFDPKFADELAARYLDLAAGKARNTFDVPLNLHDPEAADILHDVLEGMANLTDMDRRALTGKFSRGGASHTKSRLGLDMHQEFPKADGSPGTLMDLYNTDMGQLYRGYARRVAGEVALAKYGVLGKKGLAEMRGAAEHSGASEEGLRAFDQVAAELLNTPFGTAEHNWMDNVRLATSAARLGGMAFTQIAEFGNALATLGVQRTFSAIGGLPRMVKEVGQLKKGLLPKNDLLHSIDTLGGELGMDDYSLTRLFDIKDNAVQLYGTEHVGVASRAIRAGANLQAIVSGHRMILASQVRLMSEGVLKKAFLFARDGLDSAHLDDMGINERLRAVMAKDMDNIAVFSGDRLVKLDINKAQHLTKRDLDELVQAVERGASQIVQRTYPGETGKWAHDGLLKLLFQFRTFSLVSVEKQWGRSVRVNGGGGMGSLKSFMALMGAMSFAAPIYLARVQTKMVGMSRSEREKYAKDNLTPTRIAKSTLGLVSAAGLTGDFLDIGGGFASDLGGTTGKSMAEAVGARGASGKGIGGIVPGIGLANDVWNGAHGAGNGKPLLKAMPGSNLPFVTPLVNGITAK